jgi:peptide/nickel transport system substrate-binding protein
LGAVGLALALAGCRGRGRAGDEEAVPDSLRYGGTAVVAYLAEPSSMSQFAAVDENALDLQNFVLFTTLIRYDENLQPQPYLAARWEVAQARSGTVLTFFLRRDVRWHDGVPTTAHDVKFTFDRAKNPRTAFPRASLLALYDSAVVRDSFTVAFYLKRHPGYLDPWFTISPMPAHLLGRVPPAGLARHPFGSERPLGNGPFRFIEHRPGDRWVFEANPDFPAELGGRPYLDRLVYRVIEDPTTRLSELLVGEVDVSISAPPSQVEQIDAAADVHVLTYTTRAYTFINWNERRLLFQDARVRRALTLAINREQIVKAVRHGLGVVAKGPVPPFHWAYHAQLEPLPYDPEAARALLDSAGWIDRDGDGVRDHDVIEASFELKTNPEPSREDILQLVQADLAKIGVQVQPRVQEAQSLGADITSSERRFDAFVLGWRADIRLDDRILFSCSQLDGQFQWASYCNPRVDEILDEVSALEDRSQALPLWHEYQEIMQWEQPYTFLYYDIRPNGIRDRIHDVRMDIRSTLVNVQDWWIAPADRQRRGP